MDTQCPHCGNTITIVGAKELADEYGLGPNSVIHARKRGDFPNPWLTFGNRNLYLKADIDKWVTENRQPTVDLPPAILAQQLEKLLEELPDDKRREINRLLAAK